jgi:hypothetical protein
MFFVIFREHLIDVLTRKLVASGVDHNTPGIALSLLQWWSETTVEKNDQIIPVDTEQVFHPIH